MMPRSVRRGHQFKSSQNSPRLNGGAVVIRNGVSGNKRKAGKGRGRLVWVVLLVALAARHFNQQRKSLGPYSRVKEIDQSVMPPVQLVAVDISEEEDSRALRHVNVSEITRKSYHGARLPDGRLGYIADPTTLRRTRFRFLQSHYNVSSSSIDDDDTSYFDAELFATIEHYAKRHRVGTWSNETPLTVNSLCLPKGGAYLEKFAGFEVLSKKIKVAKKQQTTSSPQRLLCVIETIPHQRDIARAAALSWGYKCDGFLAFSTETIPSLGMVNLDYKGEATPNNLWQKTRSILAYIYEHYRQDYDFFHFGGEDTFVIVENLRHLISRIAQQKRNKSVLLGQWIKEQDGTKTVGGGPGYTLNSLALKRFVKELMDKCSPDATSHADAWQLSLCFRKIGVFPTDSRDFETGEQQYHNLDPNALFHLKPGPRPYDAIMQQWWETLPHPDTVNHPNETVGRRTGSRAVAASTVSFHQVRHPLFQARLHAIIYRSCNEECTLGGNLKTIDEETGNEIDEEARIASSQFRPKCTFVPAPQRKQDFSWFGGHFSNGTLGYVADPTTLKRARKEFLRQRFGDRSVKALADERFIATLQHFEGQYAEKSDNLSAVCSFPGGSFPERAGGFKLLKKMEIPNATGMKQPRLLCAVYTHPGRRPLLRAAALTWGYKCDGFLAFSTETVPSLGIVNIKHPGEESYHNMWQKVRSIWAYLYKHYLMDYDFFHLGGEDMYVIVENMRRLLALVHNRTRPGDPVFLGLWVPHEGKTPRVTGGPGYTFNRVALRRFAEDVLPSCATTQEVPHEDRTLSNCMRQIDIVPADSRDEETGEQTYHNLNPNSVYYMRTNFRPGSAVYDTKMKAWWETLPHPDTVNHPNEAVGARNGLQAASRYSVTFHYLKYPMYQARAHAIIYRSCRNSSSLAQSIIRIANETDDTLLGARFPNGTLGYVADPTLMRRARLSFLQDWYKGAASNLQTDLFATIEHFESGARVGTWSQDTPLNADVVCLPRGGAYSERKGGFALLQKIKVANASRTPRILCTIYTQPHARDIARAAALTWGYKCDGFLAFSNETIPGLGIVNLVHNGEHSEFNNWQKVRSMIAYIYKHYIEDYDYFHFGGENMFVIVENLRRLLASIDERKTNPDEQIFTGQWTKERDGMDAIGGGPGYSLNRAAIKTFVEVSLADCNAEDVELADAALLSFCMKDLQIERADSRDWTTYEQTYHNLDPDRVFRTRPNAAGPYDDQMQDYWANLPPPGTRSTDPEAEESEASVATVGPRIGMEAASEWSVSFNWIRHPLFQLRMHVILYRTCDDSTPLGQSLLSPT